MRRAVLSCAALCTAIPLTLTACSGGGPAASGQAKPTADPATGGTVHVLGKADYSHLDPARGFDGGVNNFYRLVYRTLTTREAAGPHSDGTKIVGDLATDTGRPSNDHKTWTFTLKKELFFQNGAPITSQDVKFGVERAWDPDAGIGSPYAKQVIAAPADYKGPYQSGDLDTIETPNDRTIVFHLKTSYPQFSSVVAQPNFTPFPKGTGAKAAFDTKPIASGPYQVDSYRRGATLELVRNKHWKRSSDPVRAARPDGFVFTFGLDPATMDERLIAGQGKDINAIGAMVQPATIARLRTPQLKPRTLGNVTGCTTYMSLNTTKGPLKDVRVRQAIEYAVNKQTTVDALGGSTLATAATSIQPPSIPGRDATDVYPSKDGTGDPAAARKLLAEAGQSKGFTLTVDARAAATEQAVAVAVQQGLKRVGIKVKINTIDTSTFYEVIGTPSQQHDAALTGWCPDWPGGTTFLPPLFDGRLISAKGNSVLSMLDDKKIQKRIDEIAGMDDETAQNEAYGKLDAEIMKLAPIVPLNYTKTVLVVGSNIAGAHTSISFSGGIDLVGIGLADPKK
ncbi:ABC transporter substrate-binding protein [Streptomyces sp. NBS 14/10]|uniref:ABC transporter substrate-binding protein n=1 Tax=Streptomyces sp. NBS 14/10 TaxID=1945643 RepID=UPI000B7D8635|nr:ABC transporter substrate-binding protein [Streptomyces sp. NBS 14/10]KAK1182760.1 ABC transporter substrate-binding protein [Streptomyces sp. NBS 14/10]NUS83415.1 ABC transporter substrate-binding protein [Streptomyces sp.]